MKRPTHGSTPKQFAYATRMLNGGADSKKEAALLSGYTISMAENAKAKIESTEGYHNAMEQLALKSNNLMLAALSAFEARGLDGFTNKELVAALNAIGSAWERVEKQRNPQKELPGGNRLAGIFKRTTVTETAVIPPASEETAPPVSRETTDAEWVEVIPTKEDMDF